MLELLVTAGRGRGLYIVGIFGRLRLKRDGTRAETRFSSFGETDESI